jgi:hypothetical protein
MRRLALSAALIALAGCGGEETQREAAPTLPPALAERLARDADAVADRLDAGDPCAAVPVALRLRTRAIEAVNGPAVPAALKEELLSNAQAVYDRAAQACSKARPAPAPPPPATEAEDEDDEDDENGNGRGKGKGKGKGGRKGKD